MKSSIIKGIVVAGLFTTVVPQESHATDAIMNSAAEKVIDYVLAKVGTFTQTQINNLVPRLINSVPL